MQVLLANPEFPDTFWSLSESCKLADRKTLLPPLGLLTVAALLPPEWQLKLVDLNTRQITAADWEWADMIMITGMLPQREGMLDLIQAAREWQKTIVVGGPYVTSAPEEVLAAGVNFLIRGEGESVIPQFLDALRDGQTTGVFVAESRPDLTTSPVPRYDLVHFDDYHCISVQSSRGCPFECEFCDVINLYGRVPRYKNPQQIIAELDELYRLGWRRQVFISDDNFIGNKKHARAILERLIPWMKGHGEPYSFWTQTSVNLGQDVEMIDLMTDANFNHVFLGVESPEPEILTSNRKFQNVRNPLAQSMGTINANGLCMMASFVMGFDEEKPGTGEAICRFVEDNAIPLVMLNLLYALPNTGLWSRLKAEGRLLEGPPRLRDCHGLLGFNFIPKRPPEEIVAEYVQAIDQIYDPRRYLARVYRYFLAMRPTRKALGLKSQWAAAAPVPGKERPKVRDGRELWGALDFFWRQGIKAPYRRQFWRQLLGIYRQNPSRIKSYLVECALGEDLFRLREGLLRYWRQQGACIGGEDPVRPGHLGAIPVPPAGEEAARPNV